MTDLVLGISAYYHDSAAALVDGTAIVAAAQEERFTRRRHDPSFPAHAVSYCLAEAGATLRDVSAVAYYEDPALKFRRVMASYAGAAPFGFRSFRDTLPEWLRWKRRAEQTVRRELAALGLGAVPDIICRRHHESHAASAFFPSPYESAAVLCIDGVGEWATTSLWHGRADRLAPLAELRFPHSLGMLYSAFTYFCGFKVDSGEYKLMGLAPYGTPRYADLIRERLIDLKSDGSFHLDMRYFAYLRGQVMTGRRFEELFGGPRRRPESPLTEREFDLAASVQQVTEEAVLRLARTAQRRTGETRLCLAGGVALNCVANGRVIREEIFDGVWVQPAAGDAGGALGAALAVAMEGGAERTHLGSGGDAMSGALLGPAYGDEEIQAYLDGAGVPYTRFQADALAARAAAELARGKVVGWFQDRMEFGPRALGARSILGDPRDTEMQSAMNQKIKFRESFRPFAPAVLDTDAEDYFELKQESPYMLVVADVAAAQRLPAEDSGARGLERLKVHRSTIPAVTHVDMSARVQTVSQEANPAFHRLLTAFKAETGCPVLVNTSFNVRGEPIVRSPEEAYRCFMRTRIDVLVLGSFLLLKEDQPAWSEDGDWRDEIPLD
ncbi:carbamoyltransferase [Streptomyces sp. 2224.1]|uniref:carbamoyltransferase family protein n=1 Tax=unclassified Streptomyces TaxID=2593676 RepID=UPI0008830705|nr:MULTISPECIES: carbamoyltransferase [unclassified Streptomyces]PBC82105.1 carbamoyltransferase [Streptomyces sp. 2321.6]SDR51447.1 carbamoyltransferase [Streptomyces sp. KS_16]SEC43749.1 carbamoyltransferase [Streptomyces sp. 2133.1]SEC59883.1 carbamoyltransferase [Streptomyces sp. 2224.1]SEF01809.1 carbamoyltransferase [Streptomyces sp. 2112.3]